MFILTVYRLSSRYRYYYYNRLLWFTFRRPPGYAVGLAVTRHALAACSCSCVCIVTTCKVTRLQLLFLTSFRSLIRCSIRLEIIVIFHCLKLWHITIVLWIMIQVKQCIFILCIFVYC